MKQNLFTNFDFYLSSCNIIDDLLTFSVDNQTTTKLLVDFHLVLPLA
jgi:hypothetical protein